MMPIDWLAFPCPQCGAAAGEKCKNYRHKVCAPHRDRMMRARGEEVCCPKCGRWRSSKLIICGDCTYGPIGSHEEGP